MSWISIQDIIAEFQLTSQQPAEIEAELVRRMAQVHVDRTEKDDKEKNRTEYQRIGEAIEWIRRSSNAYALVPVETALALVAQTNREHNAQLLALIEDKQKQQTEEQKKAQIARIASDTRTAVISADRARMFIPRIGSAAFAAVALFLAAVPDRVLDHILPEPAFADSPLASTLAEDYSTSELTEFRQKLVQSPENPEGIQDRNGNMTTNNLKLIDVDRALKLRAAKKNRLAFTLTMFGLALLFGVLFCNTWRLERRDLRGLDFALSSEARAELMVALVRGRDSRRFSSREFIELVTRAHWSIASRWLPILNFPASVIESIAETHLQNLELSGAIGRVESKGLFQIYEIDEETFDNLRQFTRQ